MPGTSWRPNALKVPYLVFVSIVTATLLCVVFYVHYINARYGLVLQRSDGTNPQLDLFLVRYLPTILLVLYGMAINILDMDVKRMEPWFRLSSGVTETGFSPLLCQYDTSFVLSVILKSYSKKHTMVLLSSILMLLASVVVPAVQNSMFVTRRGYVAQQVVTNQAPLATTMEQQSRISSSFLLTSYANAWLGMKMPPFATREYALAPFSTAMLPTNLEDGRVMLTNSTSFQAAGLITAPTTRFWTELECWSPAAIVMNLTTRSVNFDDGRGCHAANMLSYNKSTTDLYSPDAKYEAYAHGPGSEGYDPFIGWFKDQCPDSPNLWLMTFRRAGPSIPDFGPDGNATAMFCQSFYYSQPVNATVRTPDLLPVTYLSLGPRQKIPESSFNISRYEYIITFGVPHYSESLVNNTLLVDATDRTYFAQAPRIGNMSIITPNQLSKDITIGFALGTTQLPSESYLQFDVLSDAYNRAHRLLFAQAISRSFQSVEEPAANSKEISRGFPVATLETLENIIELSSGFVIATEICLATALSFCLIMLFNLPRRPLYVQSDPDCLAQAMLKSSDKDVQECFKHLAEVGEDVINEAIQDEEFSLDPDTGRLLLNSYTSNASDISRLRQDTNRGYQQSKVKESIESSWFACLAVCSLLVISISILISSFFRVYRSGSLSLPFDSETGAQILVNFLPVAASTLLGIYLALLCRVWSFVIPMYNLAMGHATAQKTLLLKYNTILPQLVFTTALQHKHYPLGLMSFAALASSVLTVTAAGMFTFGQAELSAVLNVDDTSTIDFADPRATLKSLVGSLNGVVNNEALYSVYANITNGMSLKSWTTPEFAATPLNLPQLDADAKFMVNSTAYGTSLSCFDFSNPGPRAVTSFEIQDNGLSFQLWANFTYGDNTTASCGVNQGGTSGASSVTLLPDQTLAMELALPLVLSDSSGPTDSDFCGTKLVHGWVRGRLGEPSVDGNRSVDYNATMIVCEAVPDIRKVRILTTVQGDILASETLERSALNLNTSRLLEASLKKSFENAQANTLGPTWHNDTIIRQWANAMYFSLGGSRDWLNASLPPPSYDTVSKVVPRLIERLFAVQVSLDRERLVLTDSDNQTLNAASTTSLVPVQMLTAERRLFMSYTNLAISLAILVFDLMVLLTYRLSLPRPFLPRMPFTIASQIAFFSNSHIVDEIVKKDLNLRDYKYGYGKFMGKDGKIHVGIEREPFVHPLGSFKRRRFRR